MGKLLFIMLCLMSMVSYAQNTPCSQSKGGINHCEGATFICNDGSASKSKKDCSAEFGGGKSIQGPVETENTAAITTQSKPATNNALDLPVTAIERTGNILKLNYDGFTVWLDCSKRGAIKFQYVAQRDSGNATRAADFYLDPNVPAECQQTSSKPYGQKYDRGHQVPANHLDSSAVSIKETNFMTNILPQTLQMNRGAWLATEELIECYRDIDELLVIGGVIWGNNSADDYFLQSHGVATPDAYWKVVIRGTGQNEKAIAWIVPNSTEATRKNLDRYLVTVDDIEKATGESIPIADYAKHDKPSQSWIIPHGCNKS